MGDAVANARTKPAVQDRSREKRDRIVEALAVLLEHHAFEEIAIADIAREAGVSPATIYQRFDNRDAAIAILMELYMRRVTQWARACAPSMDFSRGLREALRLIARNAWAQADALGHIMRPAYLYSRLRPDLLDAEWQRLENTAGAGFRDLLVRFSGEVRVADPDVAAGMLSYFFNFMLAGRLLHHGEGLEVLADAERFCNETADFAYAYLTLAR